MRLNSGASSMKELHLFLDRTETSLMRGCKRTIKAQAEAIDTDDIASIMNNGTLTAETEDICVKLDMDFVTDVLQPVWTDGMRAGGRTLTAGILGIRGKSFDERGRFEPVNTYAAEWQAKRKQQIEDDRKLIRRLLIAFLGLYLREREGITFEQAARLVVRTIGLTSAQMQWAANRRAAVYAQAIRDGSDVAEATMQAGRAFDSYVSYLQGYRARMIANTEASSAFHAGQLAAMQEARDNGWLNVVYKRWLAFAGCCDECGELDGTRVALDGLYQHSRYDYNEYATGLHPPLHPNCRCTLVYETE